MVMNWQTLKSPLFLIKVAELAFAVICTVLSSVHVTITVYMEYFYKMEFVHGTFIGFILISLVVIVGYVTGNPLKGPVLLVIAGVAAIMYLIAAIFAFQAHINHSTGISGTGNLIGAGIVAIFTCILYICDTIMIYRNSGVVAI